MKYTNILDCFHQYKNIAFCLLQKRPIKKYTQQKKNLYVCIDSEKSYTFIYTLTHNNNIEKESDVYINKNCIFMNYFVNYPNKFVRKVIETESGIVGTQKSG